MDLTEIGNLLFDSYKNKSGNIFTTIQLLNIVNYIEPETRKLQYLESLCKENKPKLSLGLYHRSYNTKVDTIAYSISMEDVKANQCDNYHTSIIYAHRFLDATKVDDMILPHRIYINVMLSENINTDEIFTHFLKQPNAICKLTVHSKLANTTSQCEQFIVACKYKDYIDIIFDGCSEKNLNSMIEYLTAELEYDCLKILADSLYKYKNKYKNQPYIKNIVTNIRELLQPPFKVA